jgi:hypothetical protein
LGVYDKTRAKMWRLMVGGEDDGHSGDLSMSLELAVL